MTGHSPHNRPRIAIIERNTLTGLGLAGLIEHAMPIAEVCLFSDCKALQEAGCDGFFHFFAAQRTLLDAPEFFAPFRHRTIVLTEGDEAPFVPTGYHVLNAAQPEEQLVRAFLQLVQHAHAGGRRIPAGIPSMPAATGAQLTPRETDVLRGIVKGFINKEIASQLNISLATVISHRKNLIDKLNIRSVSGLTIYAVMHGLVSAEEI